MNEGILQHRTLLGHAPHPVGSCTVPCWVMHRTLLGHTPYPVGSI